MIRLLRAIAADCSVGFALLAAASAFAISCGYSTGLTLHGPQRSVGVEIFDNDSPKRDLEIPGAHQVPFDEDLPEFFVVETGLCTNDGAIAHQNSLQLLPALPDTAQHNWRVLDGWLPEPPRVSDRLGGRHHSVKTR